VNIWFEPADENDVKYLGWLNITINEAQNLASPDTYVKLYLLFRGKSVRSSKMKTKVVKKSKDPIFEQKLRMPVTRTQSLGADTALELSVWDHSRLKANEVLGSVLFTVEDIASTTTTSGWFDLNNYNDGRKQLSTTGGTASRRASSGVGVAAAVGSGATRLAHMEAVKSASREDVSQFEQFSADSEVDAGKGRKKRTLPIGKTSKAQLNVQIEELRQQVRRLQAAEERHIQEKGLLEEKLQSVRDSTGTSSNLKKKNAEMMQELDDLRARTAGATELHERVETLEDDNLRLTQQLKLLNGDRARHTEEISGLRDR
jgi:polyhydroxyalkanoate synthesis regulator phasin